MPTKRMHSNILIKLILMSCDNDCIGRTQIEALERLLLIMLMFVFLILIVIVTQRFDIMMVLITTFCFTRGLALYSLKCFSFVDADAFDLLIDVAVDVIIPDVYI